MEQDDQSSQSSDDAGCMMAAKAELLEECEEQFGLLQKVICHGIVFRSLVNFLGSIPILCYKNI